MALASSTFNVMTGPTLEETQQLPMTENVAKLFTACDNIFEGKITAAEFQEEIKTAALGLKDYAKDLGEIADETADESEMDEEVLAVWRSQHLPYMQEVAAAFAEGIKECEAGLESMATYLSDPQQDHLVRGCRLVWEGMGAIHRAQLSMSSTLKMLQDLLDQAEDKPAVLTQES